MLEWMGYAVVVTALVGGAALALERLLRLSDRPARTVWTAATLISLGLPAATWAWAGRAADAGPGGAGLGAPTVVEAAGSGDTGAAFALPDLSRFDRHAGVAWGLSAVVLILLVGGASFRLDRTRRRWRRAVVGDTVVRVSPGLGPAVMGVVRPEVVLPAWVLDAGEEARRWIVAHEREHVRARDPLRLAASLLPAILLPWNLPLWWQLRRLRQAVEIDCDDRVLAGAGPAARGRYGRLLLEVGRRGGPALPLPAAFAETPSLIERRIRAMSRGSLRPPGSRLATLAAGAVLLLAGACLVPEPDRESPTEPGPEAAAPDVRAGAGLPDVAGEPTFTPYTAAPRLVNLAETQASLEASYPPLLRDAGVAGRARVYVFVDAGGRVADARLHETSGHDALDRAALAVSRAMRFEPARNGERTVPVWISLPIAFGEPPVARASGPGGDAPGAAAGTPRGSPGPAGSTGSGGPPEEPTFTPYTVAPRLRNAGEGQRALEREYPPSLRDHGIGGKAEAYLYIDAGGRVREARVEESSGHDALDRAALAVARTMVFEPARNRDEVVPVWIRLPITFQVR